MFGTVGQTPYDIEFSLFGIPSRVHPFFWAATVIFGWSLGRPDLVVIWVLCVFISILIHEMGHALLARAFGYDPHIVLHHFGGYAAYIPDGRLTPWKSIAISFAGPLAGFVFYAFLRLLIIGLWQADVEINDNVRFALGQLLFINLFWGLLNLLPVLPLDGGRISSELFGMWSRRSGEAWALRLGVAVGVGMAVFAMQSGERYIAILFGILALLNFQALGARDGY
ncbi:hypothetical protein GYB59_04730 [bacterium]|nr:hypothetical protein [bacterium]